MANPISFEGFCFTYKKSDLPALSDIDLAVGTGELVGVVGPSGAGKSTLAAAVGAFIPHLIKGQTTGRLVVAGRDTGDVSPRDLAGVVGTVFQDFESQIFSSRVDIETAFGPENLGFSRDEIVDRVGRALASVGLFEKATRVPSSLSGGEKQRLVIASILAMDPRILVFDEPVTDLDPEGQREVLLLLDRFLSGREKTALVVDHETDHLVGADRIAVLSGGRVAAVGTPDRIFRDADIVERHRLKPLAHVQILSALGVKEPPLSVSEATAALKKLGVTLDREKAASLVAGDAGRTASYGPPVVEMDEMSFDYGTNRVISRLSLSIREREFMAIVGPNGSGKTTLVKQINGLLRPTSGTVRLSGKPPASYGVGGLAEMVGIVHQNPDRMIFAERVFDEAAFGLAVRGERPDRIERRVREVLSVVGLSDKTDADPFLLTKGERQRLAVAATLAVGPKVLILDEPTTGLDHGEIVDMMELLCSLNDRGHTIICITHNMDVVAHYCHRTVVLSGGEIIADGTTRQVFGNEKALEQGDIVAPPEVVLGLAAGLVTLSPREFIDCAGAKR
jgi:energy-coupling factor transporter ATP-binding protein EcfA2